MCDAVLFPLFEVFQFGRWGNVRCHSQANMNMLACFGDCSNLDVQPLQLGVFPKVQVPDDFRGCEIVALGCDEGYGLAM